LLLRTILVVNANLGTPMSEAERELRLGDRD
jgi:hypothetical protein